MRSRCELINDNREKHWNFCSDHCLAPNYHIHYILMCSVWNKKFVFLNAHELEHCDFQTPHKHHCSVCNTICCCSHCRSLCSQLTLSQPRTSKIAFACVKKDESQTLWRCKVDKSPRAACALTSLLPLLIGLSDDQCYFSHIPLPFLYWLW